MQTEKVHPVDEILPKGQLFAYGLQHVMAMYAGCVAVPLIIANAIGLSRDQLIYLINADLFAVGIATIIQSLGFLNMGVRLPLVQGVSFVAVTPMILIGKMHGIQGIFGSVIVAGLVAYLISPYFSRLIRYFPPVVTGTIITIIGASLLPVAVRWAGGGVPGAPGFASLANIALAFTVLVLTILYYRCLKGFWSNIAVLLGLVSGTAIAFVLGLTDFSKAATAGWFGLTMPFAFGMPVFEPAAILTLVLAMLVIMTETTGDMMAVGEMVGRPVTQADVVRGLRADGFASMLGGIMNTFPYSAFAQNVGLVGLTGVRSRYVIVTAGIILVALGLFPKAAAVVAAIPLPVLGGAGIAMFGMVAASGIRVLSRVNFEGTYNAMIIAVSLGVGLIPLAVPTFYHSFPAWAQLILHSGITVGSIVAVMLNFCFNELGGPAPAKAPAE